jgi:catechol 2,3-dioxygenase-like lactoylglutathione lyase family enzyme
MSMQITTPGVHHIALRSKDLGRTKEFYGNLLGFPLVLDTQNLIGFMMGSVFIGFMPAAPKTTDGSVFTPFNVGLDHIALVCENQAELQRVATALAHAGVENTGVKTDPTLNKNYVAFKDPDRIQWEFYMT